jgi:hypothetical protein
MDRQVIGDHVNRSPLRLVGDDVPQEFDEGGAGVPGHGLAEDFARLRHALGRSITETDAGICPAAKSPRRCSVCKPPTIAKANEEPSESGTG